VGVLVEGPDLVVSSSVIDDTRSRPLDLTQGRGLVAQCDVSRAQCGHLRVASSRLRGNRELAISVFGVETEILDALVGATEPQEASGRGGRGLNAQCDLELGQCAPLTVTRTQVVGSQEIGIYTSGCAVGLEGVRVQDVEANAYGPSRGTLGAGLLAACSSVLEVCPVVTVRGSVVDSTVAAGIALYGAEADVRSSRIRNVASQPADGKHGYGIRLESSDLTDREVLVVVSCDVQGVDLAGFLFSGAGGLVRGSRVAGGDFSVVYTSPGIAPVVTDDNLLSADIEVEPFFSSGMAPMAAPPPW
jgi:hypothetical protein